MHGEIGGTKPAHALEPGGPFGICNDDLHDWHVRSVERCARTGFIADGKGSGRENDSRRKARERRANEIRRRGVLQAGDEKGCRCKPARSEGCAQCIDGSRIRCKQQGSIEDDRHHWPTWRELCSKVMDFQHAAAGQIRAKLRNWLWLAELERMLRPNGKI